MISFCHIINAYRCDTDSEGHRVQLRTLESLAAAANFSRDVVAVNYVVRTDPMDGDLGHLIAGLPNAERQPLRKFSYDVGHFGVKRSLPLLSDMFDIEGIAYTEKYIIYTNIDICVSPYFYTECARILAEGAQCMVINRRTVEKRYLDLPLADGFLSESQRHPGHDCFVFPASLLETAQLPDSILGIGYVFRPMLLNCILKFGRSFKEHEDYFLTMHFGDDMAWKDSRYEDYLEHNKVQLITVWNHFSGAIKEASKDKHVKRLIEKHFRLSFLR